MRVKKIVEIQSISERAMSDATSSSELSSASRYFKRSLYAAARSRCFFVLPCPVDTEDSRRRSVERAPPSPNEAAERYLTTMRSSRS